MSATLDAIARTRRDGLPLATVRVPGHEDVTLCNHDALHYAKSLVWNGEDRVVLITERGRTLDAVAIRDARY